MAKKHVRSPRFQEHDARIIALYNEGMKVRKIAKELGCTPDKVRYRISVLVTAGRLERREEGKQKDTPWPLRTDTRSRERREIVIRGIQRRETLATLRAALGGLREERARQLVADVIAHTTTEERAKVEQRWWTLPEVVRDLGSGDDAFRGFIQTNKISHERRGEGDKARIVFPREMLPTLRTLWEKRSIATCDFCKKTFRYERKGRARVYCSSQCSNKRNYKSHQKESDPARLTGWHRALHEELCTQILSEHEEWLTQAVAYKRAGISVMQLVWLGKRGIIETHGHPKKRWRGQPVMVYAASELDVVRRVYTAWQCTNSNNALRNSQ